MPKTYKEKIALRKECNFLLDNVVNLHMSLFPDLRYIQNLWALNIIDTYYVQNEGTHVIDRFGEEPYDTVIRILPKINKLINEQFPEKANIGDKIKRVNIISCLKKLELVPKE